MHKTLAGVVAALFALQLLAAGLVGAPPAVADGPIITDPEGDATDVVLPTGAPSEASEPSLDIVAADIAVTSDTLTTTVRVVDLTDAAPRGATGSTFRWGFTYAGLGYETRASRSNTDGATQFRLYDPTNTSVPCDACTGGFDSATDTVTVQVPLAVLNGSVAATSADQPPVGPGSTLKALEVLAQRQLSAPGAGGVTPTADTATTDQAYVVPGGAPDDTAAPVNPDEIGDATVIAVIDFGLVPYHWDFDAAHLPQHRDGDVANDLPLTTPPDQWLSGFPAASSFSSYEALPITRASDPAADLAAAAEADAATWSSVPVSTADDVHFRWIPGTKVIGAVDFGGSTMRGAPDDHGVGVTSVSTGNLHGTCPECLLVFVNIAPGDDLGSVTEAVGPLGREDLEAAVAWATSQPWIDVVTNSWGANLVGGFVRDNVYGGTRSIEATRSASERGQTVFFSAGNGIENGFVVPNTTYFSSLKGPDWMMTVGAITPPPSDANYSGAGKPVDLSSYGSDYPSAYTAETVSGTGATGFSGTSNATPVVAGIYARALHSVRAALPGPSRAQADGVVATQVLPAPPDKRDKQKARAKKPPQPTGPTCGSARSDCEIGDGVLTADELRTRLLEGARPTSGRTSVGGLQEAGPVADERFAAEGHGAYRGRMSGLASSWAAEQERILGPLFGRATPLERPAGEREWMTVDSACRQHLWGTWGGGYYVDDATTPLPAADPSAFPIRTLIQTACPALVAPPTP